MNTRETPDKLYLSLLALNQRNGHARRLLSNPHSMHGFLMRAFPAGEPGRARADHQVLHRLEESESGYPQVLIQSGAAPNWNLVDPKVLAYAPTVKDASALLDLEGRTLRFKLHANPTIKKDGKRVAIRNHDERVKWLQRKISGAAELVNTEAVCCSPLPTSRGNRKGSRITVESARFEGGLKVIDGKMMGNMLAHGIGPAKAYGMGLLSVAPG